MNDTTAFKQEIEQVLSEAELLYSAAEVEAAFDKMATAITRTLRDKNPLLLCPMLGAVVPTGQLLPRLGFPLQLEYIHATRYRGKTSGGNIHWIRKPQPLIHNRTLLIIDDILDEGITLKSIVDACTGLGAGEIYTAVLVDKQINKPKQFPKADFTGLSIPDRYVFGYGMDYKEYLRNCNGIYAVNDS
ncbi:MAG: hypoxanthine-guanine phosphoribosyltransferase [Gammaproteobacteria bacterium]